jgi:uncharacterized membrane protein
MSKNLIEFLKNLLSNELITIIIASLPISELRGAIPISITQFGFTPMKAFLLSVLGNLLPVVPFLFFLNYFTEKLSKIDTFKKFFDWWFERTKKRSSIVEKYEAVGLSLFVAIPLPMTGAWTGCVAAYLFRIKFRYALTAIAVGVLIAGIVVTLTTIGILKIF